MSRVVVRGFIAILSLVALTSPAQAQQSAADGKKNPPSKPMMQNGAVEIPLSPGAPQGSPSSSPPPGTIIMQGGPQAGPPPGMPMMQAGPQGGLPPDMMMQQGGPPPGMMMPGGSPPDMPGSSNVRTREGEPSRRPAGISNPCRAAVTRLSPSLRFSLTARRPKFSFRSPWPA